MRCDTTHISTSRLYIKKGSMIDTLFVLLSCGSLLLPESSWNYIDIDRYRQQGRIGEMSRQQRHLRGEPEQRPCPRRGSGAAGSVGRMLVGREWTRTAHRFGILTNNNKKVLNGRYGTGARGLLRLSAALTVPAEHTMDLQAPLFCDLLCCAVLSASTAFTRARP